jgi:hypothetical protein
MIQIISLDADIIRVDKKPRKRLNATSGVRRWVSTDYLSESDLYVQRYIEMIDPVSVVK